MAINPTSNTNYTTSPPQTPPPPAGSTNFGPTEDNFNQTHSYDPKTGALYQLDASGKWTQYGLANKGPDGSYPANGNQIAPDGYQQIVPGVHGSPGDTIG